MGSVVAAVGAGSQLGLAPAELSAAMEAARARDRRATKELNEAARAHPFAGSTSQPRLPSCLLSQYALQICSGYTLAVSI
jgi:hypothetical protein